MRTRKAIDPGGIIGRDVALIKEVFAEDRSAKNISLSRVNELTSNLCSPWRTGRDDEPELR